MRLAQLKEGYRYNSDTLMLYDFVLQNFSNLKGNVLDVGCGCGILGLLLKRDFKDINLLGIDIQDINVEISNFNALTNGIKAKFIALNFTDFKSDERFELIVSNPPYYHDGVKESQNEHIFKSRYCSNLRLESFINVANSHLKPNGAICFCYEAGSLAEILVCLKNAKLNPTAIKFIHPKEKSSAKLALIMAKKNSKSPCDINPPLILKFQGRDSDEAKQIYARANTISTEYKC